MFILGLIVYGSYILWTALPLLGRVFAAPPVRSLAQLAPRSRSLLLIFHGLHVGAAFHQLPLLATGGAYSASAAIASNRSGASKDSREAGRELPRVAASALARSDLIASLWASRDHRPQHRIRVSPRVIIAARDDQSGSGSRH